MKWLALLLVVGCGDNLPDPRPLHSGSRLKLAWYEYEDGTRQRETSWYYDAELSAACTPSHWSDGNRYCAPATDEAVYVNDTCTRAVGRTKLGAEPKPLFATTFELLGETLPSRVFRRGAATAPAVAIWQKQQTGCFGPFEPGLDYEYFDLGAEVSGLVQLHRSAPHGGDGELAIVDELSDDGLRVPVGFYDRTLGVGCTPDEPSGFDTVVCVPDDSALVSYFHEVGCLEPELATTAAVRPATAKQYTSATQCWRYFTVGEEVSAPPLYEALERIGTCVSVAPPGGARFFLTSGAYEPPHLSREREQTARRLANIDLVRDQLRIPDPLLYDSELAAECRREADLRCVPVTSAHVEPFFADPGCTIPLDLALVPTTDCAKPSQFARKGDQLYRLDRVYTKPIYWLSTGDTCGTYVPPSPLIPWTLAAQLEPSRFATAQLTIDP